MSEHERTSTIPAESEEDVGAEVVDFTPERTRRRRPRLRLWRRRRRKRFRIRKLRVLLLLFGLGVLAAVSAAFGMFMAVASDLPKLEEPAHTPSMLYDKRGVAIGTLTGNDRRIYLDENQIAPVMKQAMVAIEDRRFYTNSGIDLRGIARAAVQDVTNKRAVQGASTIPQQFVKITLAAENDRTLFQKLREAALAYQLTRRWSKDRILRNYLNSIYFGNGAYGIESAAKVYFGNNHDKCGEHLQPMCASVLQPAEAAMLAGIVASPSAYDPTQHPVAAKRRRDLVLLRMYQQGYLTKPLYATAIAQPVPTSFDLTVPQEDTKYPYFTSWIKQQVVDQLGGGQQGAQKAFEGGLKVTTTIDSKLQNAAQAAVDKTLPPGPGPHASLVAISNDDGEVRAMVGGQDYATTPFNLATQGRRQPGSSFKPFVLAQALKQGISPNSTWASEKRTYILKGGERFTVNNYEDAYAGTRTLTAATTYSDNAVYAQVAQKVGTKKIAKLAREMGVRTPVSSNLAMALGGLSTGVTPLDMAHAYETFANDGKLIYGSLSPGLPAKKPLPVPGPVGIERIEQLKGNKEHAVELDDGTKLVNKVKRRRVLNAGVASEVGSILQTVIKTGSGTRAQIPGVMIAGKTGTTEDYGDAWFVAWTKEYTVAVWVGYPDKFKPMKTEFSGGPVAGGTFPAQIWKTFMQALLKIDPLPKADGGDGTGKPVDTPTPVGDGTGVPAPTIAPPASTAAPGTGGTGTGGAGTGGAGTGGTTPPANQQPTPQPTASAAPTAAPTTAPPPAPTTAPSTGTGTGAATTG